MKKLIFSTLCLALSAMLLFSSCTSGASTETGSEPGNTASTGSSATVSTGEGNSSESTDEQIGSETTSQDQPVASQGSGTTSSSTGTKPPVVSNKKVLYGVGSLLYRKKEVAISEAATLINSLGAGSIRDVMNATDVLVNPTTVNTVNAEYYHDLYSALGFYGVQIVTANVTWFLPDGTPTHEQVPKPDKTPGSDYMKFLEGYRQMWKTLAAEFPEVTHWEMGNEMNHVLPVPVGYTAANGMEGYTLMEKADITTDMCYYAHKGIKEGNPKATTIFPGIAPVDGIDGPTSTDYLTRVYENIKSGKFGSKKSNDFFDAMAWHPYWPFTCPNEEWVEQNHKLYRIMQKYGDGNKKVFLTEAGFRDDRNPKTDEAQAPWIPVMYNLVETKMPYVESLHYYWLFNHGALDPYGLMNEPTEGYSAKAKGLAYQKMTGGKGDLNRYVIKFSDYESGDNVALRMSVTASSSCEMYGWGLFNVVDGNTKTAGWTNWYPHNSYDWAISPNGNGAPTPNHEEWLQVEFPEKCKINNVLLYFRDQIDSGYHMINGLPREMYVSVSTDGKNWKKVGDLSIKDADVKVYPEGQKYDNTVKPYQISFNAVDAKYVKVTFTKLCPFPETTTNPGDNYYVQLHQIEIIKA